MEKVKFGQLSIPLKIAIIMAWVVGVIWGMFFLLGMTLCALEMAI